MWCSNNICEAPWRNGRVGGGLFWRFKNSFHLSSFCFVYEFFPPIGLYLENLAQVQCSEVGLLKVIGSWRLCLHQWLNPLIDSYLEDSARWYQHCKAVTEDVPSEAISWNNLCHLSILGGREVSDISHMYSGHHEIFFSSDLQQWVQCILDWKHWSCKPDEMFLHLKLFFFVIFHGDEKCLSS